MRLELKMEQPLYYIIAINVRCMFALKKNDKLKNIYITFQVLYFSLM